MITTVKRVVHDRPWLLVVAGLAGFVALDVAFLIVAILHPQTPV